MTSRNQGWCDVATCHRIEVLSRLEAMQLLRKRSGSTDDESLGMLAARLGNLPLALQLAAAHIKARGISINKYISEFDSQLDDLSQKDVPEGTARQPISDLLRVQLDQIEREMPDALELLRLLAFFAPTEIPVELVLGAEQARPPRKSAGLRSTTFADAMIELRRWSLIAVNDGSIGIHPLVQASVRESMSDDGRRRWAEVALELIGNAFAFEASRPETWSQSATLVPHALVAAKHAEELGVALNVTARLLDALGLWQAEQAQLNEAEETLRKGLLIAERVYGSDHPMVAVHANNLARILQENGNLDEALHYAQRAVLIAERAGSGASLASF